MTKDTGGQAFPGATMDQRGMTLWDYFAGNCLCGIMALHEFHMDFGRNKQQIAKDLAINSYIIADAMISERNKDD